MNIIKLPAIDSTNDFLKELSQNQPLENFTAVIAEEQTNGRGQMGATWTTEKGKNLIMSVLVKDIVVETAQVFDLNVAISVSIVEVLQSLDVPDLAIKWPNDILSDGRKIAGILIENRFKSDSNVESVVGIGLNVNQEDFTGLPQASSLAVLTGKKFDVELIFEQLIVKIQRNCHLIAGKKPQRLWEIYLDKLFKKDVAMIFEDNQNSQFTATIVGVTKEGLLEILPQGKTIQTFGIKEIKMIY